MATFSQVLWYKRQYLHAFEKLSSQAELTVKSNSFICSLHSGMTCASCRPVRIDGHFGPYAMSSLLSDQVFEILPCEAFGKLHDSQRRSDGDIPTQLTPSICRK